MVTAAHVVDGAEVIEVQFGDEAFHSAKVVRRSSDVDLAVLSIDRVAPAYLPVEASPHVEIGDRVFTIGFPVPEQFGWEPKFTDGVVSSLSLRGEDRLMQLSVPIQGGNSGGAIVREDGVLVGIAVMRMNDAVYYQRTGTIAADVSFATKSSYLVPMLEPAVLARHHVLDRQAAIKRTEAATCKVLTAARSAP